MIITISGTKAIGDFVSIWEHKHDKLTWLAMDGQKHRDRTDYPNKGDHNLGITQHGEAFLYPWFAFDLGRPQRVTEVSF